MSGTVSRPTPAAPFAQLMDDGVLGPHGQLAALSVSITERDTATTLRLKMVEVTASATIWMGEIAQGAGAEFEEWGLKMPIVDS